MESTIKKKVDKIVDSQYQHIIGFRGDLLKYIEQFLIDDRKIHSYTNVSFSFHAYPIFLRFYPLDAIIIQEFMIRICNHIISEFKNLPSGHVDSINNFQAHRLKVVSTAGLLLPSSLGKWYLDWCEKEIVNFIGANLRSDGTSLDFELRDSITYVTYTLGPLVNTCTNLVKAKRPNYYFYVHPDTLSQISNSVRWLLPYISEKKTNVMFLNSVYKSDKSKPEYGKYWDRNNALHLLNESINFDKTLISVYTV